MILTFSDIAASFDGDCCHIFAYGEVRIHIARNLHYILTVQTVEHTDDGNRGHEAGI